MGMSSACTPPTQPIHSTKDEMHPRFREYLNYRSAMASQLVTADSFARWLESVEREKNGFETVFEVTNPDAALDLGWYKHVFGPYNKGMRRHGPFVTQAEAKSAS